MVWAGEEGEGIYEYVHMHTVVAVLGGSVRGLECHGGSVKESATWLGYPGSRGIKDGLDTSEEGATRE